MLGKEHVATYSHWNKRRRGKQNRLDQNLEIGSQFFLSPLREIRSLNL